MQNHILPEAKAKIERSFRTIKDGWMRCTDWNEFTSLEDIKRSLSEFIYNNYNNKIHSSLNSTPNERWHNEYESITFLDENFINNAFLHREERKVRKDQTISFNNKYYEVPFKYVGKTIKIRYNPLDTEELFIFDKEDKVCVCTKVDKVANSKIKRKNGIDYSKAINDERNVIEKEEN